MSGAQLSAARSTSLSGVVRAPGDKSISHRALIFGALATGTTTVEGLLEGEDVLRTAAAMRAFGARVEQQGPGRWRVEGQGGFAEPVDVIDCGNAGTAVRLILGAAAGFDLSATFTGDQSLRGRPMGRVLEPLARMGATWLGRQGGGKLPLTIRGGSLRGIEYRLPVASAQVKSAVLLAGLHAEGGVTVIEPELSRDHTERMLGAFGGVLTFAAEGRHGRRITLPAGQRLTGTHVDVPGDPSSADFPIAAALVVPGSQITVENVLLNPSRIGLFETFKEMGADLVISNRRDAGGEPVGDITVRYGPLKGVEVPPERAPSMIDEYPILSAVAAFAEGKTVMRGIGEMRVKESDRIALMAKALSDSGVDIEEEPEGMIVRGTGKAPRGGATVVTHGDHRIAMSNLIFGLGAEQTVTVNEPEMIATSFPGFVDMMRRLGATIGDI
jgi:3-phosphoshikimate 1-carboxyvinyltransferase